MLTSSDCCTEDVGIIPVVIAELKFRDVERHVFGAHLAECAHHVALEDGPEALNCLGMDRANSVLPLGMVDNGVGILLVEGFVADPLVRAEQTDLVRNCFVHKADECGSADVLYNASDDVAFYG